MDAALDTPPPTYLRFVKLNNFRCFKALEIQLHKDLTVLIARNGAGKTTVLDAIAITLGTFVGSFQGGTRVGAAQRDVRLEVTNEDLREMEPQFPLKIEAFGVINGQSINWMRQFNSAKSGTTIKDAKPLTNIGKTLQTAVTDQKPVVLPVIAYYGTGRLWKQKKLTERKAFASEFYSRTSGYQDCLDPASSYGYFLDWFRYASQAESDYFNLQRERSVPLNEIQPSAYAGLLAAVRDAVNICLKLSGWHDIRYSFKHKTVVMEHAEHGTLEVGQLSDGVRNMVALVADIAYRMVRLNSHFGRKAAQLTPGVVLIDEVDMHLHPEWQQQVLTALGQAFPLLQLIVTTHSPQVLTTVRQENIRVLSVNVEGKSVAAKPLARTYGRSNAEVMCCIPDDHMVAY